MSDIARLTVIGSGTMGHGIGQLAAMRGIEVSVYDVDEAALERARKSVETSLGRFVKKESISEEESQAILGRMWFRSDLDEALSGSEVVIEAVPEILELKQRVFTDVDARTAPDVLLATNTSQLSITAIASATANPQRVVGMHFFNPPVIMRLVEIIRGTVTTDEMLQRTIALSTQLGKESIVCQRDTPGFITTRAIMALRLECIRIYEEGIASMEDLDKAMRLAFNHPMGQFELNDYNGLDIALQGSRNLREAYGERFAPPPSLVARVAAGRLGRKSGAGWYEYTENGS
ncbi:MULTISPECIES: 3-hydroxyacyl-CoA dehydrogenase family protein [unclassified Microbacterium]|uniref:3-hydroxyacyl-CoA dehydrogenase family protein n=1 Tax=unclassified Microbacterium TaxID=2609290 RepID=UPI000C6AF532|nr:MULTISPECIES: 3-hydroxyacyl-CoA dehydrogenase family protein [unclassified Microbacterium]MBU19043.1 3-hydroxybutyryl-CoA dehydrogenase [Microbacterium sp.]|tara:strand:- start:4837 stop:5706 length:870 start_codon:yes stop_codon:yes gene_type:complete